MHVRQRQRLPRLVVVVEDEDVVVRMTADAINMRHREHIAVGEQLLAERIPQLVDVLHVAGVVRVELLLAEALHHRPHLNLATVGLCETLAPLDELIQGLGVHHHGRHPVGAVLLVLLA